MIVVAIIGILAAIAIPNFLRYQLRSKTSEAKVNLGSIKTNLIDFRGTHRNEYPGTLAPTPTTGVPANGGKSVWDVGACPGACTSDNAVGCTTFDCIGWIPEGDVYYEYRGDRLAGLATEYGISAQADLDVGALNGMFGYGTDNANLAAGAPLVPVQPGTCVNPIPAFEVADCNAGEY
jgi:type IV pilus assembly protein PilA